MNLTQLCIITNLVSNDPMVSLEKILKEFINYYKMYHLYLVKETFFVKPVKYVKCTTINFLYLKYSMNKIIKNFMNKYYFCNFTIYSNGSHLGNSIIPHLPIS